MMSDDAMATPIDSERPAPPPEFLSRLHKQVLLLTMLTATFTFSAGLNPPGPSLSESDNGGAPLSGVLLSLCCGSTAFVACLVLILFLLLPPSTRRVKYWALQVAMTMNLFAMIGGGTYIFGSCRAIYVIALAVAVLLYICIQLQLIFWSKRPEHVDAQPPEYFDAQQLDSLRRYLLLLAILAVSISYNVGINPPGGSAGARQHHVAGDPTIDSMYSWRHLVFFYCNSAVFVAALAVTLILLSDVFNLLLTKRIKYLALQSALTLKLYCLTGAYAARSCRELPEFMYFSVLGAPVVLYVAIHVMVFMTQVFPVTWRQVLREKVDQGVPGWLKKPFELPGEEEGEKKNSKLLLLLLLPAILATSLTYHDGISLSCDNLVNYQAFFYSNTIAFVASLAIITLLMNKKTPATGIRWHALRVCVVLEVVGLTGAFAAGGYRKTSTIDVLVLVLAVLLCIVFHVALSISGTARGLVQRLVSVLGSHQLLVGADPFANEDDPEDEMEFGITGGTDEEPLAVEISSPILEGALTIILPIPVMAILANPVKLPVAILIASIVVSLWRRSFARLLRALARALQRRRAVNQQGTPPTGSSSSASSTRREQLVSAICQGLCKVIHTLCVGTWMWLLILVTGFPSLGHNLKLKYKMSKIVSVLGVRVGSAQPTATAATATTDTPDMAMSTGATSTTTTTTVDTPSTATSSTVTGNRTARTAATTASSSRGDGHLVEPRPRRDRRPNSRLIGQEWVN